jgi:hypothetical protein
MWELVAHTWLEKLKSLSLETLFSSAVVSALEEWDDVEMAPNVQKLSDVGAVSAQLKEYSTVAGEGATFVGDIKALQYGALWKLILEKTLKEFYDEKTEKCVVSYEDFIMVRECFYFLRGYVLLVIIIFFSGRHYLW